MILAERGEQVQKQFLRSDVSDVKTDGTLRFNDNVYLSLGTGNDVEHYWNGSNYYTDINSGANWYLRDGNSSNESRFTFDIDTGNLTGTTFTGALSGNASTATKWKTARTLTTTLVGDVSGTASMSVDGTGNKTATITTAVSNDSHTHSNTTITSLDGSKITSGTISDARLPSVISSNISGNSASADKWSTARTLTTTLTGDASGTASMSVDGSGNKTVTVSTVVSHSAEANKWSTARSLTTTLAGDVTGTTTISLDGTSNKTSSVIATVVNDSHNHSFSTGDFTVKGGDINLVNDSTASIKYNNSTDSIDFAFGS